VHHRRLLPLFDQVGAGWEPFDVHEIGRIPERRGLTREDRQCTDEVLGAFETGFQLDDPLGQTVAEEHPAPRPVTVKEPDLYGRSHVVTGRGDRSSYGGVVWMTGESVRRERNHHIRLDPADELRCELDQYLTVDLRQAAVQIVETSRLDEPKLFPGRVELPLADCRQGRPRRRARVPDLAGSALGQRDHADLSAGTRVLREGTASAEGLIIWMGEDSQQT
jgi:hypothetical protein